MTRFTTLSAFIAALVLGTGFIVPATAFATSAVNPGDVVINEFVSNPTTGSEWVELYNNTSSPIDLAGWSLSNWTFSGGQNISGTATTTIDLSNAYVMNGNTASSTTELPANGRLVVDVTDLNNARDSIMLRDGTDTLFDQVTYGTYTDSSITPDLPTVGTDEAAYRGPDASSNWYIGLVTKGVVNPTGPTTLEVKSGENLQDAINTVVDNGTVIVEAGYDGTENLTVSHPVKIMANAGAKLTGSITISSSDVTVDGLDISNPTGNNAISMQGVSGITITNNTIHDIGASSTSGNVHAIVYQDGASDSSDITISNNTFTTIGNDSTGGSVSAIGVLDSTGTAQISNVIIDSNTITGITANPATKGAYGIILNHATSGVGAVADAQVTNNTISGLDGLWAHAIGLEGNTPNLTISGNTISDIVDHKTPADAVGVNIEDNAAALNAFSIATDNSFTNVAWNVADKASTSSIAVDSSWTDASNGDLVDAGNGVAKSIGNNAFATIADGVSAVASGGTVSVVASSSPYTENVTLAKPLTLTSADANNKAQVVGKITVASDDVTVSNLDLSNPSVGYGIVINGKNNVSVTGNTIHDIGTGLTSGSAQAVYLVGGAGAAITSGSISNNVITNVGTTTLAYGSSGSAKGIYVGDTSGTGTITGLTVSGNTISDVVASAEDWPTGRGAYGVLVNFGGATTATIESNTISNLAGLWAHAIGLEGNTPSAVVSNNTITNLSDNKGGTDEVALRLEDNAGGPTVSGTGNTFDGTPLNLGKDNIIVDTAASAVTGTTYPEALVGGAYYYAGINILGTIPEAVAAATSGATVTVGAGTYSDVQLTGSYASNIAVTGDAGAVIDGLDLSGATFNGLTFKNFTFTGDSAGYGNFSVTIGADGNYSNLAFENNTFDGQSTDSRGAIFLNRGFDGFTLSNNSFKDYASAAAGTVYSIVFAEAQGAAAGDNFTASENTLTGSNATNFLETYRWQNVAYTGNTVTSDLGRLLVWSTNSQPLGNVTMADNSVTVTDGKGLQVYNAPSSTVAITGNTVNGGSACLSLDSVSVSSVSGNTFENCGTGVVFSQSEATTPTSATFSENSISGNAVGVQNNTTLSLDATKVWWGDTSGPEATTTSTTNAGAGDSIVITSGGDATYIPWYADALMTTLKWPTSTSGSEASTTVTSDTTLTGTSTTSGDVTVTATIPAGTVVTGDASWDGTISAPTATSTTVSLAGYSATTTSAVSIGSSASNLTFDKAVKLVFAGQTGTRVGWYNNAGDFTEITTVCGDNTQTWADANLADGADCKYDDGVDMIVWTKHFTTFTTYTAVPNAPVITPDGAVFHGSVDVTMDDTASSAFVRYTTDGTDPTCSTGSGYANGEVLTFSSNTTLKALRCETGGTVFSAIASANFSQAAGGTSSGGGGGGGGGFAPVVTTTQTQATTTTEAQNQNQNQGEVLGAAAYNFAKNLSYGSTGTDVTELQKLLIAAGFDIPLISKSGVPYGFFGPQTKAAVIAFQKANNIAPAAGFVGPITRGVLNKGVVPTTPEQTTNLTSEQAQAILSLLESFNADAAVIAKVKASLGL